MSPERCKDILFCTLQTLRDELIDKFYDSKDCDDYIFSLLDMEVSEILEIYEPRGVLIYTGSAFKDGTSPKDYAWQHEKRAKGEPIIKDEREV